VTEAPELNADIEEADVRTILYALHFMLLMPQHGSKRLVVLSSDSEVLILILYYWSELKSLWIKTAAGDTSRYVAVHEWGLSVKFCLLCIF